MALAKVTRVTTFNESGAYSDSELTNMAGNSIDRKKIRDELKIERTKLFKQFAKHPKDTRLALAVKILDDQIADYTEWTQTNDKNTEIERKNV